MSWKGPKPNVIYITAERLRRFVTCRYIAPSSHLGSKSILNQTVSLQSILLGSRRRPKMTKFNPSKMKLISRTAMERFNSNGDTVGYSSLAGVQTNGTRSKGISSASLVPSSVQADSRRDVGPPVSGCKNILPAAAWYSLLAKPTRIDGNFDGIIKPNPFSFRGQVGARNYAAGSVAVDQTRVGLWTRPLSPHLTIYYPYSNSTASIINRMTGIYLTAAVLAPYLLCMKVGTVAFSYDYFYQLLFYSSKLGPLSAELAALAFGYHVYKGIGHLVADVTGSVGKVKKD